MAAELEIAGQFGSQEASAAVVPVFQNILKVAAKNLVIDSLDNRIKQLSLILRVSGKHQQFEGAPVENVKFDRKLEWISCDLLVWTAEWEGKDRGVITEVLIDRIERVPDVITPACNRKKIAIDTDKLRTELKEYTLHIRRLIAN